ncbi:hypothetical protein [Shewanella sp. CG12_big_fil_rev_8_21_14_0_65_47_15]|uniref:hypothetical protein n=1 Tax=Shewanella sp. CG12_big_fil_rev_8_21_14_0_65_47_15 TaxID=1975537 RepID=UPI0025F5431D|nr:hypothetical protein [Shewanella sp. CG12_big_fil_rev_8_21_14_0_65_47_15]
MFNAYASSDELYPSKLSLYYDELGLHSKITFENVTDFQFKVSVSNLTYPTYFIYEDKYETGFPVPVKQADKVFDLGKSYVMLYPGEKIDGSMNLTKIYDIKPCKKYGIRYLNIDPYSYSYGSNVIHFSFCNGALKIFSDEKYKPDLNSDNK